ncbi:MAG: S49 family peptidase [Desulfobacterales bacterium]|nr:S49 family peptidase [Desulfobacterales bacterium]
MEYFVATACDRIILHPLGWLGINGLGGYVPFLKGALDKLGVRAEFEHVEEYKTAANMFTEKGFTPAHREEMGSYYGDLFAQYVATAAKARGKTEAGIPGPHRPGLLPGRTGQGGRPRRRLPLRGRGPGGAPAAGRPDDLAGPVRRLHPRQTLVPGARERRSYRRPHLRRRNDHDRREPAPDHGRRDGGPLDPDGPDRSAGQGHRASDRQPRRVFGRLGRHLARGRPGQEAEAGRRVHVRRGRVGRLLDRHVRDQDRRRTPDPDGVHRGPGRQVQHRRTDGQARRDRGQARLRREGRHLLALPAVHGRGAEDPQGRDRMDLRAVPDPGRGGPGPDPRPRSTLRRPGPHLDRPPGQGPQAHRRARRIDHGPRHGQEGGRHRRRRGRPPGHLAAEAHLLAVSLRPARAGRGAQERRRAGPPAGHRAPDEPDQDLGGDAVLAHASLITS